MGNAQCRDLILVLMAAGAAGLAQLVVPVEQEPHHRTVLQNAWVRVLDVRFEPGVTSGFHRHSLNNVAVRVVGGTTRADTIDAEGQPRVVATGSVVYYSASPPYVHRVTNVGTAAVQIVDVELSGARTEPVSGGADDTAAHVVEVENEHVRVSRIRLGPGQSLPAHTHPRGWLHVVVTGEPGTVAWHDAAGKVAITAPPAGLEFIEVEPR
jgi:quercetin dioxygenase-like cupin family protein